MKQVTLSISFREHLSRLGKLWVRDRWRIISYAGWRRWLVLLCMGVLIVLIEVRNHAVMWERHKSGQTILSDPELLGEIFLYGLIFPILGGFALEYIGYTTREKLRLSQELDLRRSLATQMNEEKSWQALTDLIVASPGTVVAAERAWLLAQRSGEEEFEQITHWERPGSPWGARHSSVIPAVCESCLDKLASQGNRITICPESHLDGGLVPSTRYCLPLASGASGKALLLFDLPAGDPLAPPQLTTLKDLADEMTMAIGNANLHKVTQHQLDVARTERLRIARDLHDTLGQNVSYLRLKLEHLNTLPLNGNDIAFQNELAQMRDVAEEAYEQLRDTLEELRSTQSADLEVMLKMYATPIGARAGFVLHLDSHGPSSPLSSKQSRQLMYIVREAFNNIEKHAAARNVEIHLHWYEGELELTVRDDGRGFHLQDVDTENRYGLIIMAERARALNANLVLDSAPQEGTELILRLPLSRAAGGYLSE